MDINGTLKKIMEHPDSSGIGMIASHLGLVRGTSRDGRKVKGVEVSYDLEVLNDIVRYIKGLPGIIEVMVEVNNGLLNIGDEILFLAVGGDIRENVFPALEKGVNMIKKDSCTKKEIFV